MNAIKSVVIGCVCGGGGATWRVGQKGQSTLLLLLTSALSVVVELCHQQQQQQGAVDLAHVRLVSVACDKHSCAGRRRH